MWKFFAADAVVVISLACSGCDGERTCQDRFTCDADAGMDAKQVTTDAPSDTGDATNDVAEDVARDVALLDAGADSETMIDGRLLDVSDDSARGPTVDFEWANWPMPNPPSTGLPHPQNYDYTSQPGVVKDLVTGLVWQRTVEGGDAGAEFTWNAAQGYCATLALTGSDDWRLPTRIELISIVDQTRPSPGPVIDLSAFPNAPGAVFWSASPSAGDSSKAWTVDFGPGFAAPATSTNTCRVRCVRAGASVSGDAGPRYSVAGDGTAYDSKTMLRWKQNLEPMSYTWTAAQGRCQQLAGGSWRVPSMKELMTIVDVRQKTPPVIDAVAFPGTAPDFFWTSSQFASNSSLTWTVTFLDGSANIDGAANMYAVRCVQ